MPSLILKLSINTFGIKIIYLFVFLFAVSGAYAQAPNISYTSPQNYTLNGAITPLAPSNTGGAVPANTYGQVSTYAGTGTRGNVSATVSTSTFYQPRKMAVDATGNMYVLDDNNFVRKITPDGVVTQFAGSGAIGSADGIGTAATFFNPIGIAVDAAGNIYLADSNNNLIRKITPQGAVTTLAGNGAQGSANGTGTAASFKNPTGIIADAAGNLYIADQFNNMIRKITPSGVVTTLAGNGSYGVSNGPGTSASFSQPYDLTIDNAGNLYVADGGNSMIRKVTPAGVVTTLAGNGTQGATNGMGTAATFKFPSGITFDGVNLYVADGHNQLIRKVTLAGEVTTLAGSGTIGLVNGTGTAASFSYPYGVGADRAGNVYVADNQNSVIRKIAITGYTIDKPLPTGLLFDSKTGIISGTPTTISPATIYTITGYNTGGSSTTTVSIAVTAITLQPSVITFPLLQPVLDADANFNPHATSTNHETPITYTSSNPNVAVVLPNGLVHVIAVGTTIITANQAGNANYTAATPVFQTLYVTQQEEIYFPPLPVKVLGDADFEPGAISNVSAFPVTYTSSNPGVATIINGKIHIVGIGTAVITASQAGNTVYIAATPVSRTLTVNSSLVFNPLPVKNTCDVDFDAGATSTFPITYSSSNAAVATVVNSKIHIVGAGTATITATSNGMSLTQQLQVTPVLPPSVTISASLPNPVCAGTSIQFTASAGNAGTNPAYQWQINGINTGANLPSYSNAALSNNDIVTCTVTNTSTICLAAPSAVSNSIQLQINAVNIATIAILYDNTPVCAGTALTFRAQVTGEGSAPVYQWQVNGVNAGSNSKAYTAMLKNNDVVTCILTSSVNCSAPVISAPVIVRMNALPEVAFKSNLTINQGDMVQLKPVVSSNIIEYGWSPAMGLSDASSASPIAKPTITTTYQLRVKTADGCYAYSTVTINVINPIVIYNTFTPNGDNVNDTWEIPMLAYYPNCTVNISNRYGTLVYQSRGYAKAWDGTRNGQPLPVGTYYYVVDLKDGKQLQAGSVTIIR